MTTQLRQRIPNFWMHTLVWSVLTPSPLHQSTLGLWRTEHALDSGSRHLYLVVKSSIGVSQERRIFTNESTYIEIPATSDRKSSFKQHAPKKAWCFLTNPRLVNRTCFHLLISIQAFLHRGRMERRSEDTDGPGAKKERNSGPENRSVVVVSSKVSGKTCGNRWLSMMMYSSNYQSSRKRWPVEFPSRLMLGSLSLVKG